MRSLEKPLFPRRRGKVIKIGAGRIKKITGIIKSRVLMINERRRGQCAAGDR